MVDVVGVVGIVSSTAGAQDAASRDNSIEPLTANQTIFLFHIPPLLTLYAYL